MDELYNQTLKNKKIAYIHKSGRGWGGAQQNLYDLINHFRAEFGETLFVGNRGLLFERIEALKVKTYPLPIASVKLFPLTLIFLGWILMKEKPDLIHSNHRYVTLLVVLLRKFLPLHHKILHTARSVFNNKTRYRSFGDKIVANSQAVQKNLIEKFHVLPEQIQVINDGVRLNTRNHTFLNQQNDPVFQMLDSSHKTIIGCVGSLVKPKGHYYLIQALAQLSSSIRDRILVLFIGDGPLRKNLAVKVKELNLTEVVKFLGYREDVPQILNYCHFLVIPSLQEGLPNVVIEGYLLGKPTIVSELDYIDEVIKPYEIGLVFPVMNTVKLAEAIQHYVEHPELVAAHGATGQKILADQFSLQRNLNNYHVAYQKTLAD